MWTRLKKLQPENTSVNRPIFSRQSRTPAKTGRSARTPCSCLTLSTSGSTNRARTRPWTAETSISSSDNRTPTGLFIQCTTTFCRMKNGAHLITMMLLTYLPTYLPTYLCIIHFITYVHITFVWDYCIRWEKGNPLRLEINVTIFGKNSPLWQYLQSLGQFL